MNKDQVNGTVKNIAGKVQEGAGKLLGNKTQEAKGIRKQVQGQVEKAVGDIKEVAKDSRDAVKAVIASR